MKTRNIFYKLTQILLVFVCCAISHSALALGPKAYMTGPVGVIAPRSEFNVSVYIDAVDPVNAVDMEIKFPKDKLQFLKSNDAGSLIDLWQTKAAVLPNGNIGFSGGIMRSFTGNHGLLLTLSFKALTSGNPEISFVTKNIFLANGEGTKVSLPSTSLTASVQEGVKVVAIVPTQTETEDSTVPELTLTTVENPADGVTLIVFNAKDPESGIKSTTMRFKKWRTWSAWFSVVNPSVYPAGAWVIEVKAENNKGLENTQSISQPSKMVVKIIFPVFVLIILVYIIKQVYNKRKLSV